MRLPASQARALTRGAKKTLRVPVDPRLAREELRPVRRGESPPFRPTTGMIVAVQGGEITDGRWVTQTTTHIVILGVERCRLGWLTDEEAQAEGFETPELFVTDWVNRREPRWVDEQVERIRAAGDPDAELTRELWPANRYATKWADSEVWVLKVAPANDVPYLLPGLPGEPEAIPVERLDRRWVQGAQGRHRKALDKAREDRDRELLSLEERVVRAHQAAARQNIDVSGELYLLRKRLDRGSGAEAVVKRLQVLENRVYRNAA